MDCEARKQFYKLKIEAEEEFKKISLPPAMEPLGIETPQTHYIIINAEYREKRREAEKKLEKTKEDCQNHLKICNICKKMANKKIRRNF